MCPWVVHFFLFFCDTDSHAHYSPCLLQTLFHSGDKHVLRSPGTHCSILLVQSTYHMALKHTCACEWRICLLLEIHCGRRCTQEGSGQLVSLELAWQTCCAISLLPGYSEPLCPVVPDEEPPLAPRKSHPPRSSRSSTQSRPLVAQEVVVLVVPLGEVGLQACLLAWPIFRVCGFCCCFVCSFRCWKGCRKSHGGQRIFQSQISIGNEDIQFFWTHQS